MSGGEREKGLIFFASCFFSGMDPIVFAAVCGAASGMVGFVVGGAFFNAVWRMVSSKAKQIEKVDILCSLE